MAWIVQDNILGMPRIGVPFAVPSVSQPSPNLPPVGEIVPAVERSVPLGGGEFIFLGPAPSGVNAGTLVGYDQINQTVTVGGTPSSGASVAFASCAIPAGQYGWYQIGGVVQLAAKDGTALSAGGTVGLGTVAGTVGAVVATRQLLGAKALNAATAGATTAAIQVDRPRVAQS